jgi:alginate O-acetyltransferase complex protein AlgI
MLFNSYEFLLVFLPAAIAIYAVADRYPPARMPVLITLSLVFYGYWDVRFVPLMLVSIAGNWYAARLFAATKNSAILTAAIVVNLAVLGTFKYTNFVLESVAGLAGTTIAPVSLVLPLGISFFTFHHIMYLADLRRGRAPIYPLDRYALYICFFPQAISGPIARWNEVMDQFGRRAFAPGWERRCAVGTTFIVLGLLQKTLLADPLAAAVDPVYAMAQSGPPPLGLSWMALAFAFQVFFDFAGYSDVAIGLALIFGIELPRNFDAPFRATSMLEFWQRWHMTLARFLRDYVFTPLSRLRIGGTRHRITRLLAALLLTMALCGLWHGAGWHYVVWGTLQGVGLVVAAVWRTKLPSVPAVVGWAATVGFFVVTIVFFRADSLADAWHVYQGLAVLPDNLHPQGRNVLIAAIVCAVVLPPSHEICRRLTEAPRLTVAAGLAAAVALIIAVIGDRESYQFIYFQF